MSVDDALSRPDTKAGKYQRACLALLRQHEREGTIPTNGRFLFYELEQQGVIPKAYLDANGKKRPRQPSQDLSDATMRLRELGLVSWGWILDETCSVATWRSRYRDGRGCYYDTDICGFSLGGYLRSLHKYSRSDSQFLIQPGLHHG